MIYLDNNATTQPCPEVVEAMLPLLRDGYANPSSVHQFGQAAKHQIECARLQVAKLIGAHAREIVFTGGGTEAINLAIRGILATRSDKRHFLTTKVEHSAVLRVAEQLERDGYRVDYVGVDRDGQIDSAEWESKLSDDTALASIIHANNETGVISNMKPLVESAEQRGISVHVDAVQSAGKLPVDLSSLPVSLLSLSAHKFHGPKGVGALFVRRKTRLAPLILGGNQERLLRGGTENVAGIVGMGVAAQLAEQRRTSIEERVCELRNDLDRGICERIPFATVNAQDTPRICNTTNISFDGLGAEAILILLSEAGICASSGAACSSGSLEPSHVLQAMGIEEKLAHSAVRFSLSQYTTRDEIEAVLELLPKLLARLTALSR